MEYVGLVIFSLLMAVMAACFWMLVCNQITFRDRGRLMDAYFDRPDWETLNRAYEQVTYEQHMWRRGLLRDPWSLYDIRLQRLVRPSNDQMTAPTSTASTTIK